MSVYTTVETDELEGFLSNYSVGALRDYEGISDGIENTNYFVNTLNGDDRRFVLTLFEHHTLAQMQYYLGLMHHLTDHRVPSADPVADNNGNYVRLFKHKPAALVHRLNGGSIVETEVSHCEQIGAAMGKMHAAGLSYDAHQPNPRGPAWCASTADAVCSELADEDVVFLQAEVDFQKSNRDADIPRGVSPQQFMEQHMQLDSLLHGKKFTANGLNGYTAVASGSTPFGTRRVRYVVIYRNGSAYIVAGTASDRNRQKAYDEDTLATAGSLHSLSTVEKKLATEKKLDIIRTNEMERLKATLPQNGHVEQINTLTESIINKVVRQHVKSLKKVAHDPEEYKKQIELILSIYELENEN